MINCKSIFLSYSRNDNLAAGNIRAQLEGAGLTVFKDDENKYRGALWLEQLQGALDLCGGFVVLVGRDGVRRWIGAETQTALIRYFSPHDDSKRLPIFPILLDAVAPDSLPAFLRLFQPTQWNGSAPLPNVLLEQIRECRLAEAKDEVLQGCPYVGLDAFRIDQAQLFFGRQKETLQALTCFDLSRGGRNVRWLEINGNSGSGKSSLMMAGILPLVDQGWLWPRTRISHWLRIGPVMPGHYPVEMLAESLARFSRDVLREPTEMAVVLAALEANDYGLGHWLRGRKREDTAFMLAVDQFEELFTLADPNQRMRFARLLTFALKDCECPFFLISTIRADFLDRYDDVPTLLTLRNELGKAWTLPPIGDESLREIIEGPARLAGLDVSEIQEAMVDCARGEPGALPLVENALFWLWEKRKNGKLSGREYTNQGGLAGILSCSADTLLEGLGYDRGRALDLLFRLVRVDPEGRRHTRQRLDLSEAIAVAGSGTKGEQIVDCLAGRRERHGGMYRGPLRLITVTEDSSNIEGVLSTNRQSVNLIHETLIRGGQDAEGKTTPYWPTLWNHIQQNKEFATKWAELQEGTRNWLQHGMSPHYLWSDERIGEIVSMWRQSRSPFVLTPDQERFLGPINSDEMLKELEQLETPHRRRALIGKRLAILGDPRRGVSLDSDGIPVVEWCDVPAGQGIIEINGNKVYQAIDAFRIARYPITVAQYRAFLSSSDGWNDPRWWDPDLDQDVEPYNIGNYDNFPAVAVSWYDATAFCRWMSWRLGLTVRLPNEWEWHHAAGMSNRIFPWGNVWNIKSQGYFANTSESRLGSLTSVGMYPAGAAPTGALDMLGNVWEWCTNNYDNPNEVIGSDTQNRALRGGSYRTNENKLSSVLRLSYTPNCRNDFFGFRIMSGAQQLN